MNERITIVSDKEVRIQRNSVGILANIIRIVEDGDWTDTPEYPGVLDGYYVCTWDALGRAALRDCINCLEATGSFAALSDTSPIPFVGKRMLVSGFGGEIFIVSEGRSPTTWDARSYEGHMLGIDAAALGPLAEPPEPKVRAYTPVEAAAHLGRAFVRPDGHESETMLVVVRSGVATDRRKYETIYFQEFAQYKWADDGSPCGVIEA